MYVNFRYSDADFIAYLMTLGYEYNNIEVTRDRSGLLKAFVYFEGNRSELIKLQNDYKNGLLQVDVLNFVNNRKIIIKIIKSEILKHQVNSLSLKLI